MHSDILILGGGLSGLHLAARLIRQGRDVTLIEARDRLGGRILSQHHGNGSFDLGPAWFWPGQPHIYALIEQLGLTYFDQYADGIVSFEDQTGRVHRGQGFASMQGAHRLEGGLGALISALADTIPNDRIHLSCAATHLQKTGDQITVTCQSGAIFTARTVILALPPRVASTLTFAPELPASALPAMQDVATWMAGHAKAVAVYDTPFWREDGLSGDATSRHGPMIELHDASPASGGPFALFGFLGVPPSARRDTGALKTAIRDQLARLFGPQAAQPRHLFLKDWAMDPFTATALDHQPVYSHAQYGRPHALQHLWDGAILFAGTEMARQFGGYLEGALESAEDVLAMLDRDGK